MVKDFLGKTLNIGDIIIVADTNICHDLKLIKDKIIDIVEEEAGSVDCYGVYNTHFVYEIKTKKGSLNCYDFKEDEKIPFVVLVKKGA